MSAPPGNKFAAKAKRWTAAIERAIARKGGHEGAFDDIEPTPFMKGMDELADKFVENLSAGELAYFKEFGDRMDGKPAQAIEASGADGGPLIISWQTES